MMSPLSKHTWQDYPSPDDSNSNSPNTPASTPPPESPYTAACSPSASSSFEDDSMKILPPLSGPLPTPTIQQLNYQQSLTTLLGSLATALSSLPPLVPDHPEPADLYDDFASLASQASRRSSWRHLQQALEEVWGVPDGVRVGHITRGENGTKLVLTLFERVGVDLLSRLDCDQREEAIAWTRSLTEAATQRSLIGSCDVSEPLFFDDSPSPDQNESIAPEQTWQTPTIHNSKRYHSVSYIHHFNLPPSCLSEDDDDLMSEMSYASSASTSSSGYNRPPTISAAPKHLKHSTTSLDQPPPPKRLRLSHASLKYSQPAPPPRVDKLATNALPRSNSAPSLSSTVRLNPPTARVAAKNATSRVQLEQAKVMTTSTPTRPPPIQRPATLPRAAPPPPAPLAPIVAPRASLCGRPQRDRKMPTWLNESVELHAAPTVIIPPAGGLATPAPTPKSTPTAAPAVLPTAPRERDRRRERRNAADEDADLIAADESRHKPGQVVLARMPWGWWPCLVLDKKESADLPALGICLPDSYLCKSIPTGGDWRWLPPDLVHVFPAGFADNLLRDRAPDDGKFKGKQWRDYRADAREAARIILDPKRLKSWSARKTPHELSLEQGVKKGR